MNSKKILVLFVSLFVLISIKTTAQSMTYPIDNQTIYWPGEPTQDITFTWTHASNEYNDSFEGYQLIVDNQYIDIADINTTSYTLSVNQGNHTCSVLYYWKYSKWPYNIYHFTAPLVHFSVNYSAPVISNFTQTPDPANNGSSVNVTANLGSGIGNETYQWTAWNYPSNMTFSISPNGNTCVVQQYCPYKTTVTIILQCIATNQLGTHNSTYFVHLNPINY